MLLLPGIGTRFIHFLHYRGISFQKIDKVSIVSLIPFFSYSYLLSPLFPQLAFFEFLFMPSFLQPLTILFHMFIISSITKL